MRLHPPLPLGGIEPEALRTAAERVFEELTRVIGYLDVLASPECRQDPGQTSHLYTTVQVESLMLVDYIEGQVLWTDGIGEQFRGALDAVCFAVRHEFRRAFTQGRGGDEAGLDTPDILRNCLQQSYLILAKVFDPGLEGEAVFDSLQERREQSLALWEGLIDLLGAVREARGRPRGESVPGLLARIEQFRAGTMQYLMSRDWVAFDSFASGLRACQDDGDAESQLHQLDCYVELLLNHVRMRSALADVTA